MMKAVKKFISAVLVLAMSLSGMSYTYSVQADTQEEQWKTNAVTVPAEGELVGAGYIDVEFDNSMEGYTYTVYLDGKPIYWIGDDIVRTDIGEEVTDQASIKTFTSEDQGKTEVYTTQVSKHEITVKATKGAEEVISDTRTFYVSKKGLALGGDMTDKIQLKQLNCSWYYNWAAEAFNNSVDEDVAHVPMMWGDGDDSKEAMANFNSTSNYILGFNEPDIDSQANMFFVDAIDTWKEYISPLNIRKVSPAPAAPNGSSAWLLDFMEGEYICRKPLEEDAWGLYSDYLDDASKKWVDGIGSDVDAVCLHYYMAMIDLDGLLKAVENLWNQYHKPIWITEISVFGVKGFGNDYSYDIPKKRAEMEQYIQQIVTNLDANPHVERYCWFAYDVDSANAIDNFNGSGATAMYEYATGRYTPLGKLYSRIGNPEGYRAVNIQDAPEFQWEDRVGADATYNLSDDTVTVTWNTSDLDVVRQEILIDEQIYDVENGGSIDASEWADGTHTLQFVVYGQEEKVLYDKTKKFEINRKNPTTPEQNTTSQESPTKAPIITPTPDNGPGNKPPKAKVTKPKQVKKLKGKNIKKHTVKLTWRKVTGAKKYQIQYALNRKFTKKVKSKKTTKATIKIAKLSKKKKYYFRVRAINAAGKGKWSAIKQIKIKK